MLFFQVILHSSSYILHTISINPCQGFLNITGSPRVKGGTATRHRKDERYRPGYMQGKSMTKKQRQSSLGGVGGETLLKQGRGCTPITKILQVLRWSGGLGKESTNEDCCI